MSKRIFIVPVCVAILVHAGAAGRAGASEIHEAVKKGDLSVVKALVEKSPAVASEKGKGDVTPLHLAAVYGRKEIAEFLVRHGAEIDARMDMDFTPLHCAIIKNSSDIVRLLVDAGADVNAVTGSGLSCLHVAVQKSRFEIVKMLVENGADVRFVTKEGATALDWAAEGNAVDMVDFLAAAMKKTAKTRVSSSGKRPPRQPAGQPKVEPEAIAAAGAGPVAPSNTVQSAPDAGMKTAPDEQATPDTVALSGEIRFRDGAVYRGGLLGGKIPHGNGVIVFPDGEKYEGEWINGEKCGQGVATLPDGETYVGQWKGNRKHGRGVYSFSGGEKYDGEWVNDREEGSGTYYFADGTQVKGMWKSGTLVSEDADRSATHGGTGP